MTSVEASSVLAAAEEALQLAQVEPERARRLALTVLAPSSTDGDASEAAAMAERALGLVARELDDMASATAHLRRSVEIATSAGLPLRAAQARMSLSLTLAYAGHSEEALRQAELAAPALPPADRGRLEQQRALILQRLGRLDEALEGYRRALPLLRRTGNADDEARLMMNRGVAHAYQGNLHAAEADLKRAADGFDRLGQVLYAAKARHNLGFVVGRRGDIPAALRWYDRAEADYRRLGVSQAIGLVDRCETLLAARLVPEAVAAATRAAEEFEASGMEADLAQARLLLAQAVLLQGEASRSAEIATRARGSFLDQHRPGWAALASYAWLRATWTLGDASADSLERAGQVVDELVATGWVGPAIDARLITARLALGLGLVEQAEAELHQVSAARRSGPAEMRARAWYAEALLRHSRGERRGADVALRAGMSILARHQAALGATELRVNATARSQELASLGMRLAWEDGRPARVLAWAERARAGALRWRPALPPADADIADLLSELRHVVSMLEEKGFAAQDPGPLLRRQAALEGQIRQKTWCAHGEDDIVVAALPTVAQLTDALKDAVLIELVELDGELRAIVLQDGRTSLHVLGPTDLVEGKVDVLRFALRRLAMHRQAPASGAAGAFADASDGLDRLLLGPLGKRLGDRPVVMVPTGPCHALPWASLPSLRGRPVSVAPSAALWLRAVTGGGGGRGTVLVAGPGLDHGDDEITEISRLYQGATTLRGREAQSAHVVRALNGADLVHIAAHGRFRADNPLFSSLQLVDGPLTVYDFERLRHVPRRIVLSSCEAGQSFVASGNELMGVSSALLSLGARTLVASLVSVPDEVTRSLMVHFHRGLLGGRPPAEALASAQDVLGAGDHLGMRTSGFVCFGAG